jgi:hypothetical protein
MHIPKLITVLSLVYLLIASSVLHAQEDFNEEIYYKFFPVILAFNNKGDEYQKDFLKKLGVLHWRIAHKIASQMKSKNYQILSCDEKQYDSTQIDQQIDTFLNTMEVFLNNPLNHDRVSALNPARFSSFYYVRCVSACFLRTGAQGLNCVADACHNPEAENWRHPKSIKWMIQNPPSQTLLSGDLTVRDLWYGNEYYNQIRAIENEGGVALIVIQHMMTELDVRIQSSDYHDIPLGSPVDYNTTTNNTKGHGDADTDWKCILQ